MSMKELLERLQKATTNLAAEDADLNTVEMTPEKFVAYATDQIEKAAGEKGAVRKARLDHLGGQIAAVLKNWEGPTPGVAAVEQYRDPGQVTPTSAEGAAASQPVASNFGATDVAPPAAGGAGSIPSGGEMPPSPAGSSGFASPEAATFAKGLEALGKKIEELTKGTETPAQGDPAPAQGEPAPNAPAASGDPAPAGEGAKVEKSVGILWPNDMNTSFGRGDEKAPAHPEWGYDAGSEAERLFKAEQEQAAKDAAAK